MLSQLFIFVLKEQQKPLLTYATKPTTAKTTVKAPVM